MYNLYMILVFFLHACLLASPPLKQPQKSLMSTFRFSAFLFFTIMCTGSMPSACVYVLIMST